jgi:hypothetical protein
MQNKYKDITLGTAEAVFNKLGGQEGIEKFLRGETKLVFDLKSVPVWKTFEIEDKEYYLCRATVNQITDALHADTECVIRFLKQNDMSAVPVNLVGELSEKIIWDYTDQQPSHEFLYLVSEKIELENDQEIHPCVVKALRSSKVGIKKLKFFDGVSMNGDHEVIFLRHNG